MFGEFFDERRMDGELVEKFLKYVGTDRDRLFALLRIRWGPVFLYVKMLRRA